MSWTCTHQSQNTQELDQGFWLQRLLCPCWFSTFWLALSPFQNLKWHPMLWTVFVPRVNFREMKCSNFSKSVCWLSLIRTVKAGFFNEVLLIQSLFYSKGELELWGCQKIYLLKQHWLWKLIIMFSHLSGMCK